MKTLKLFVVFALVSFHSVWANQNDTSSKLTCAADAMYIYNFPLAMARSIPGQTKEVEKIQSIQLGWYKFILADLLTNGKSAEEAQAIVKAQIDKSTTKIDALLKDANQKNFNEIFETKVLPIQVACNDKFMQNN